MEHGTWNMEHGEWIIPEHPGTQNIWNMINCNNWYYYLKKIPEMRNKESTIIEQSVMFF